MSLMSSGQRHSAPNLYPVGCSDSDWGGCKINKKSTSGFVFTMAAGAVAGNLKSKDVSPSLLRKQSTWPFRQLSKKQYD